MRPCAGAAFLVPARQPSPSMGPKQADKGGSRRTCGEDHSKIIKKGNMRRAFLFILKKGEGPLERGSFIESCVFHISRDGLLNINIM
jgi:hypothetical protein